MSPRSPRALRVLVAVSCAAIALIAVAPMLAASSKDRRFFSAREGVGLEAPPGWTLSLHTGYPNVLAALVHPGGSRISLAVDRTSAKDATKLADQSRPGLVAQGLAVDRIAPGAHGGVVLEARAPARKQALRQLYIVRDVEATRETTPGDRQAIVLTLTAPDDQMPAAVGSFDWVVARLSLEAPSNPDKKPDGGR